MAMAVPPPQKRRLKPDDPLFFSGNAARNVASKSTLLGAPAAPAADAPRRHVCERCTAAFASAWAMQLHHAAAHEAECAACGRALATPALLEQHVLERHDAYFAARVARGEKLFACVAPGCGRSFKSAHGRDSHMATVHRYPHDFAFHVLGGGGRGGKARHASPEKSGRFGKGPRPAAVGGGMDMDVAAEEVAAAPPPPRAVAAPVFIPRSVRRAGR
uniref:C2H2-type domain-containing protein n=1 Tax=Phaeomonas parva TaxID=124430 RepID=A0A7S1TVB8_9STRA|mmetsp:Transcript_16551/g.50815  ORF Transcript_16551/g.50815 Transcript_16551/m.50815 type:complete len:217 (+) Transcript_16551:92-742(+)